MIDTTAFHSMTYGLYIISSKAGQQMAGCVVNTFQQITATPLQVSVALNKENVTTEVVRAAGRFVATCLSEDASMELIGTFGFRSSKDFDKFAPYLSEVDAAGIPYVAEQVCARFSARVVSEVDLGTHVLFIAEVEEAQRFEINTAQPMTYAYYQTVKGGKTPPKASSYLPEDKQGDEIVTETATNTEKYAWRCTICGHIEFVDELPDDYTCPLCGVGKDMFERIVVEQ